MTAFEKAAIQHKPLWRMATKGLERLSFSPNLGAMLRHLEGLQRAHSPGCRFLCYCLLFSPHRLINARIY